MGTAYLAPYGVGLGHASRLVMVADHLVGRHRQNGGNGGGGEGYADDNGTGVQVRFSSYGEAANYVSMHGYQCVTVPPVEFAWSSEGGFSVKNSIAHIPRWFANLSRQVNCELRSMTAYSPDVILSDSRLSPLVAAKLMGIPSIVFLNQVKLLLSPRLREFAAARLFERMVGEVLGGMWGLADRILVPDLPPPYTISAHNVWGIGSAARKLEYVGFMAPRPHVSAEQVRAVADRLGFAGSSSSPKPVVFVHISGPMETHMPMIRLALEAARPLDGRVQFVFSEGRPRGSPEPRKVGQSMWYYEWCPIRDEIFAMSDLVVLRGGHVALSQAIQFGKPVVTIPIDNHGEQLGNSQKVAQLGLGVMVEPKKLRPEQLAQAIEQALSDTSYARKARELMVMTEKMNGIENVARIIRSYV